MRKTVFILVATIIAYFAFTANPVPRVAHPFENQPFTKTMEEYWEEKLEMQEVFGDAPTTTHQSTHTPTCGRGAAVCNDCVNSTVCGEVCAEQTINWKVILDYQANSLTWYWEAWAQGCMSPGKYFPTAIGTVSCFVDPLGLVPCIRPEHNAGTFTPSKNKLDCDTSPIERTSSGATTTYEQGGGMDTLAWSSWWGSISDGHTPALKLRVCIVHVECDGCEPESTHQEDFILMESDMVVVGKPE